MPCRHGGEARCHFVGEIKQVHRGGAEWNLPRLERSKIEHLVGHLHEVQHLHLNLAGAFARAARISPFARCSNGFGEEPNRAERSAKFMRKIVNKL